MTSKARLVSSELAQRYALWRSAEWQKLLTHLEWRQGFAFILLTVPDDLGAEICRQALERQLGQTNQNLLNLRPETPAQLANLTEQLLELHPEPATGAIWVEAVVAEAIPQFAEWRDGWREFLARLNRYRNVLQRQFEAPLFFVGPNWMPPLVREIAPDLWSVRTLIVHIEADVIAIAKPFVPAQPAKNVERLLAQQRLDPELALQSAERLRGQAGQETLLASLLHRAGRSFLNTSTWQKAKKCLAEAVELRYQFVPESGELADTLFDLSESLQRLYLYDEAITTAVEALKIYQQIGRVRGEANSISRLADIALEQSDNNQARLLYERALQLHQKIKDVLGEANCIQSLGDIALQGSNLEQAHSLYERALLLYQKIGHILGEANCISRLGDIVLQRSNLEQGRALYERALRLHQKIGDLLGEANNFQSLGQIALLRSDDEQARLLFERALSIYQKIGDVLGEANCIHNLGHIALLHSDDEQARSLFERALSFYQKIGDALGEANCTRSLGDVALEKSDPKQAQMHYELALKLFQRLGSALGEAGCIQSLGDIEFRCSNYEQAHAHYEQALLLYQRAGNLLGEANCIRSLGNIALRRSDHEQARARYEKSLGLYGQIPDPYSMGQTWRRLAGLATTDRERQKYVQAARAAWERIDRPDLIKELDDEFGSSETTTS